MTVKVSMTPGLPCFRNSAGMLSTPGDLPSFSIHIAFSASSLSMGETPVSLFSGSVYNAECRLRNLMRYKMRKFCCRIFLRNEV